MKKPIVIAIAVLTAVAVLITAGAFMFERFKHRHILDGPGMVRPPCYTITSCRYYTGGGMDGGSNSVEVYTGEDDKVYLSYYDCPYNGAEEKSYTIEVGSGVLDEIQQALSARRFLSWGELPKSDSELLDAPVTQLSVTYGDNEHYTVSSDDELPEEGIGVFSEIYNIFKMYMQGDD